MWNSTALVNDGNATSVPYTTDNSSTELRVSSAELQVFTDLTIVFSILILLAGTVGNTTVLVIFTRKWKTLKHGEMFMLNLAISDLIGGFFYIQLLVAHERSAILV